MKKNVVKRKRIKERREQFWQEKRKSYCKGWEKTEGNIK
jgi:hypothetical protein